MFEKRIYQNNIRLAQIYVGALLSVFMIGGCARKPDVQPVVMPWGNLQGIRVDGQLMKIESNLQLTKTDGTVLRTAKERQSPKYTHKENKRIIKTQLDSIKFREMVDMKDPTTVRVGVKVSAKARDTSITDAFFCLSLPAARYAKTKAEFIGSISSARLKPNSQFTGKNHYLTQRAGGIHFNTPHRKLQVKFSKPTRIRINYKYKHQLKKKIELCFPIMTGPVQKGDHAQKSFTIKYSGKVDNRPDTLSLDTSKPGRTFDGIGGNFRLQNKRLDPQVINYNLKHLRVAWGRVEFPWQSWQPKELYHPIDSAKAGKISPKVEAAIKMAQRLNKKGIPLILSAWYPPAWAVEGKLHPHKVDGVWGNALNPQKMNKIYKSITNYIRYLKNKYGVKIELFSFNESDLGINIRQTPDEHDQLIKGLGAYFKSHGLDTKMILGDASDANGFDFIKPAMKDSAAKPFIGAIDFHSWRGWADSTLKKWFHASQKLHRPLIVGEGSINAKAWKYPQVFEDPRYARQEINLYVRLLALCQPQSILQWQLTSDYSVLAGGAIWGNHADSLHPTQRFWDLKQLASTPKGLHFMPIRSKNSSITSAALGNNKRHEYMIHLVNNGPTRRVTITGLPPEVHQLHKYVTTATLNMKSGRLIKVRGGKSTFKLRSTSFTSLMTAPPQ